MSWLSRLIWQPTHDARLIRVEGEVSALKKDITKLKEQTAALEALREFVKRSET